MGSLTLPAGAKVYVDTAILIYSVQVHPVYALLWRPSPSAPPTSRSPGASSRVDTPGVTAVNPGHFTYHRLRRPIWPLELAG